MPVTAGKCEEEISQRKQYANGGLGRRYWDYRDDVTLGFVAGSRILDAGCGEGITLGKLVSRFPSARVEGVDADPANVAICRGFGLPARHGSVYQLEFPDASFDAVLFMEVIEHLDRPEAAVAELARVLKPGGRLIVVFPFDRAMFAARVLCLRFREAAFDPGHVRQHGFRSIRRLLEANGLAVLASRGLPLPRPLALHGLVAATRGT